ncbi:hypothetical protein ACQ4PT_069071 [Festuca glaucescens]
MEEAAAREARRPELDAPRNGRPGDAEEDRFGEGRRMRPMVWRRGVPDARRGAPGRGSGGSGEGHQHVTWGGPPQDWRLPAVVAPGPLVGTPNGPGQSEPTRRAAEVGVRDKALQRTLADSGGTLDKGGQKQQKQQKKVWRPVQTSSDPPSSQAGSTSGQVSLNEKGAGVVPEPVPHDAVPGTNPKVDSAGHALEEGELDPPLGGGQEEQSASPTPGHASFDGGQSVSPVASGSDSSESDHVESGDVSGYVRISISDVGLGRERHVEVDQHVHAQPPVSRAGEESQIGSPCQSYTGPTSNMQMAPRGETHRASVEEAQEAQAAGMKADEEHMWPVIKGDVMAGILKLAVGDSRGFARLNRAYITLIPKHQNASEIRDFRPISLVHSFSKLFSKLIANRLKTKLPELVSSNQSAFVRGRNLHDNFLLVRQVARRINRRRQTGVLLKLDISKAFDSISWGFLLEVLRHMGFGPLFLKWVASLLYTANTMILVNGMPGDRIRHARGLRQGDPTSPMLFVIGMEVLTLAMCRAEEAGLFQRLAGISPLQRISIYADDVVVFSKPTPPELHAIKEIL